MAVGTLWEGKDATPAAADGGGFSDSGTIKRLIRDGGGGAKIRRTVSVQLSSAARSRRPVGAAAVTSLLVLPHQAPSAGV